MPLTCEVCGAQIKSAPSSVEIDGAILRVCPNCARRGRPMREPVVKVVLTSSPAPKPVKVEAELEVDPDYNVIVREAREKLGLSQEALGMMINVKPSLISHVETKKLKPDIALARKLMHQLKVNLLISAEELDRPEE